MFLVCCYSVGPECFLLSLMPRPTQIRPPKVQTSNSMVITSIAVPSNLPMKNESAAAAMHKSAPAIISFCDFCIESLSATKVPPSSKFHYTI